MKAFRIEIDVTQTTWDTAEAYVEAETEEEARALFEKDPWEYSWDNWDTHDSEVRGWNIESVEFDQWATDHLIEDKKKEAKAQTSKQEETK